MLLQKQLASFSLQIITVTNGGTVFVILKEFSETLRIRIGIYWERTNVSKRRQKGAKIKGII